MTRKVGMMDLDKAKMIIEEGLAYKPSMGFNLNGLGEPLLYKWMPEVLQHIQDCGGTHVDFFTSLKAPDTLVERIFDKLSSLNLNVMLAITKHIYDQHGGDNLDLEQFERNFHRAMALPSGIDKNIAMIATRYHKVETLETFKAHYEQYLPPSQVHVIRSLNPWFNTVADMAHPDFGPQPSELKKTICDYPFILLHVVWDGAVLVCCTDDISGELKLGKIEKPGDLKRIWESEEYQELRRKHNAFDIDMAPCNKCERTAWARL